MTKLYLAIPCYNEEEVLRDSAEKLLNKYSTMMAEGKISADSRIVFIDDGSKDRTWEIISELHTENPIFQGIKLSRNRGHQNALLCGLMTLKDKADAVISIDADLQDDINTFDEMVAKYENGCDVVYGVRSKRETDTFFKRFTAEGFYKILNHMGAKVIFNHADFRLMSKRALNAFSLYKETNIFLRGMVPMIGGILELIGRLAVILLFAKDYGYPAVCLASPVAWILAGIPNMAAYLLWKRRTKNLL